MKICCIPSEKIPKEIANRTDAFAVDYSELFSENDVCWIERQDAEKNPQYKQLIPYVIVRRHDGKCACYPRHGTEKRLHGLYSFGVGGHVEESDKKETLRETLECGMYRELSEELVDFPVAEIPLKYIGLINETETETGLVHLGIVFLAECDKNCELHASDELKGLEWKTTDEAASLKKELWSDLAFRLLEV